MPVSSKITVDSNVSSIRESVSQKPAVMDTYTSLPDYHLIKTKFIPQAPEGNWDQPWQDACEEAALLTGYYYYSQTDPQTSDIVTSVKDMIEFENTQGWTKDVSLDQMLLIATDYLNLKSSIILDNPDLKFIKTHISQNHPIVVPASGKTLFQENKNFKNGGPDYHNLVILGYDDQKQQFITHDVGTRKGAYFRYSYNLLLESIHDLPPSHDKHRILEGPKRILVLIQ